MHGTFSRKYVIPKISLNKFKKIGMITSILFNIVVEQECTELEKKKEAKQPKRK